MDSMVGPIGQVVKMSHISQGTNLTIHRRLIVRTHATEGTICVTTLAGNNFVIAVGERLVLKLATANYRGAY